MKKDGEEKQSGLETFVGLLAVGFIVLFVFAAGSGSETKKNTSVSLTTEEKVEVCKSYIGNIFGRDKKIFNVGFTKDDAGATFVQINYLRPDDNTKWTNVCFINGMSITWAAVDGQDVGRWRWEDEGEIKISVSNVKNISIHRNGYDPIIVN